MRPCLADGRDRKVIPAPTLTLCRNLTPKRTQGASSIKPALPNSPYPTATPTPPGSLDLAGRIVLPEIMAPCSISTLPTWSSPSKPRAGLRARAESSQQPERGRGALRPPRPGPPEARGRSTLSRSSISFSWARRSYSSRVNSPRRGPTSSSAGTRAVGAGGPGATSSWASLQVEGGSSQTGDGVSDGRGLWTVPSLTGQPPPSAALSWPPATVSGAAPPPPAAAAAPAGWLAFAPSRPRACLHPGGRH